MKKRFSTTVLIFLILTGLQLAPVNRASAQTSGMPVIALPLTNGAIFPFTNLLEFTNTMAGGFTNTLLRPTNLAELRLTNVVTLLLGLQSNIEEVLPVLAFLTSNATVNVPSGTLSPGTVVPITSAPSNLFLTPTGRTSGTQQPDMISLGLGTNLIEIDPSTFQGLMLLRDDLEQTLPVLQMLNGTQPSQTNTFNVPTLTPLTNAVVPATANFGVTPLGTTGFPPPLTNAPKVITNPRPF